MSLADLIASDVDDVFLQTDDFAELITYWPKGKGEREITVTRVSLGVYRRQAHVREIDETQHHQKEVNELAFFVKRDETTGMLNPQLGDAIRLSTDHPDTRWDFVSIEETCLVSWVVVFRKTTIRRAGHARPPRS